MTAITSWKRRALHLKAETYALYLASKDPRVPWYASLLEARHAETLAPPNLGVRRSLGDVGRLAIESKVR